MTARAVPYPANTKAKGWRFELDYERIDRSDTWSLAGATNRPWLLMLWLRSWAEEPCGSLPNDDELIAAKIGMPLTAFTKARAKLMRGWWLAEDGRLYHDTVVERVNEMLAVKERERSRKADWRKRQSTGRPPDDSISPDLSHGTTKGQTGESGGKDATGTGTSNSVPDGTGTAGAAPAPPAPPAPAPEPPPPPPPDPDPPVVLTAEDRKRNAWRAAKSMLEAVKMPKAQTGTFLGKLAIDYGNEALIEVIEAAIVERPADPAAWLKASCQRRKGERAANEPAWRAEQRERTLQAMPGIAAGSYKAADQFFIDAEVRHVTGA